MNNWTDISHPALLANFQAIQHAAGPGTEVLAVLKARAYGHGVERVAPTLVRFAGARWLGVTSATEGALVRDVLHLQRLPADLLVMSGALPEDLPTLRRASLTPVLWSAEHLRWFGAEPLPFHLEVDTGMGRQGVRPGAELDSFLAELRQSRLRLTGLFTHLASSEVTASPKTRQQQHLFEQAVRQVAAAGLRPSLLHLANSSAVDNPQVPPAWLTALASTVAAKPMVRTGLALYGLTLPLEAEIPASAAAQATGAQAPASAPAAAAPALRPHLTPVLTWHTRVLSVQELPPGESTGYNSTFTADSPRRTATLAVGYADGLRRELSSTTDRPGGWVILHGQRAPILGRISMNLTVVDVSAIPQTTPGDPALLLGPGITAEDHARLARTIAYEILCGIHPCA